MSSSSSHLLSSSLGPCGARQVNARACLERSSFNVLRFFDTVLLKMYQFSSYRWWSLLALFHKKLGMGEEGGLTISSVTTDQGYIREVTAVSEPLQSLPPITFTSLSSVTHPQSFPPKTQTTSLSTKSFTNLNPPLLIVTGVVLLLSFLVGKNLKWIEKNSQKQPSNIYWMIIIVNHLLIWLFSQASSGWMESTILWAF